jgi:GTP cyclohydrolase I
MKDIQNQLDHRKIDIKKVGVKTITYPITVLDKAQRSQKTIATINMYVNLPHHFKGTHMSRFIEILNRFHGKIDIKNFKSILVEMKEKLDAEAAHLEMAFPFFLHRGDHDNVLKVSKYECAMHCSLETEDDLKLDIVVPIAQPYDNSNGAAQAAPGGLWGTVLVNVRFHRFMWLEDLIEVVESTIRAERNHATSPALERKPLETLLYKLEERFNDLTELQWYSITVENISQGYSLFATTQTEC